jgi:hypothetical protein
MATMPQAGGQIKEKIATMPRAGAQIKKKIATSWWQI